MKNIQNFLKLKIFIKMKCSKYSTMYFIVKIFQTVAQSHDLIGHKTFSVELFIINKQFVYQCCL